MSAWHREHPELTGTSADPWMANESYRRIVEPSCTVDAPCEDTDECAASDENLTPVEEGER